MGKRISEAFGTENAHLIHLFTKFGKDSKETHATLLKTKFKAKRGVSNTEEKAASQVEVSINFYANKLVDANGKSFGYCLILQPILN